ncbi:MAG: hypothetical protein H0U29_10775, partial [Acidimicrobiia bacterium]|nr:hypothetical protein [Acidimicrobiia bacterium]
DRRGPDDRLFVADLIDLVAGVLAAPVSSETADAAASRRRARSIGGASN